MTGPRWPVGLDPVDTPVYVRNELVVPLPAERVWARLVAAADWPTWYASASRVALPDGDDRLGPGTGFRWVTLGVRVTCVVDRWEPHRVLGWTGRAVGGRGHHRWLLSPVPGGTRVVTEETQAGPLPSAGRWWLRAALLSRHQRWLEGIGG
ncbi:SRPBCC family protein [Micromonospora sp. NPDC000089]|uniref:SRPBCC family protein n=1 Tax=unclassified Micromonospora TaxID=2617518 RepID=UPI003694B6E1